jgi:DtxR family Mn-dependent transcriptional regulator
MMRKTAERYIETIYLLEKREGCARTGRISAEMKVGAPSVTEMLRTLQEDGYVKYEPYKGARLTISGKRAALRLMKTHKTIADFLRIIGIERELAEIDACQIEHCVSPKTVDKLRKFVEFVSCAPHEPIWIKHFSHYVKTGERRECEFHITRKGNAKDAHSGITHD